MIIGGMQTHPLIDPAIPCANGALRLADWGLIRAQGEDALSFLHGQLTQDVMGLAPGQARLAGYCSAKGRLLASFVMWRSGPQEVLLACSADLLAATLKRLSMFVLRAKCKLSDASADLALFGVVVPGAAAQLAAPDLATAPGRVWSALQSNGGWVIRLPDADAITRYLMVQPAAPQAPGEAPPCPPIALAHWQWLEVRSAIPRITAATADRFVPQMVNLELVGGVNFQKGCYPGQEIVARSQYRGTIKRRAMLFDCDAQASVGLELFHSADPGQPAGMVANAAPRPGGGSTLLAEVKLAALAAGSLHLQSAVGPVLRSLALPYAMALDD